MLRKKFKASLEAMQLEAGPNVNSLTGSYEKYGSLVTYCWFKILWGELWHYRFTVHLYHPEKQLPRER